MEQMISLPDTAPSEHLTAACAGEIDKVISEMLRQSRDNYAQIEELALECSSALTSAQAKATGLSEQSLFRRLWNLVTGKNERLRTAIEQDRAAAQYAMQQAINSVLKECTQNRLLALAVKSKLENEMIVQQTPDDTEVSADTEEAEEIPWADAVQEAQAQEEQEAQEELWLQDSVQ
ncbi:MAG: hypothetical protein IJR72_04225 [Oscillospiraceae bacterium]|nr:hypothetical protein [Oscillospiraceae bacterium]